MRPKNYLLMLIASLAVACSTDPTDTDDTGTSQNSNTREMRTRGDTDQGRRETEVGMGMRGRDQGNGGRPTDVGGQQADLGTDTGGPADMSAGGDMGICPDPYEPNNVVGEATMVNAGDTLQAANCGFDDDDIYAINLNIGDEITLVHTFTNAGGNLDLNLHAPSQMNDVGKTGSYAAITFSFDDVETLTHVAEESGTYYILSFNNNETNNPYTLSISVQ